MHETRSGYAGLYDSGAMPLQYMLAAAALWLNRQQQSVIDYLMEENRLLKARLGDRKIHFTDIEWRRLAPRAKALGRKALSQIETIVTPRYAAALASAISCPEMEPVSSSSAESPSPED